MSVAEILLKDGALSLPGSAWLGASRGPISRAARLKDSPSKPAGRRQL